jgi:hypothetical protein
LRSGPHQDEEARYWQANLLFARVSEQAGHPPPAVYPGLAWHIGAGSVIFA